MTQREHSRVGAHIRALANRDAGIFAFPTTGAIGLVGAPDWLLCIDGLFVGIEIKTGRAEQSALQRARSVEIMAAGAMVYVVGTIAEADHAVRTVRERAQRMRARSG